MYDKFEISRKRAQDPPENTFDYDRHRLALGEFSELPKWEKLARSMAGAIVNQKIYIDPEDKLIGRVYYKNSKPIERADPDLDYKTKPKSEADSLYKGYSELCSYQLATWDNVGHIAWDWNSLLKEGTDGLRKRCHEGLLSHGDRESFEFYNGVLIMLDALDSFNEKHIDELIKMGKTEQADICKRVPRHPARTFYEAVQSFFMQYIVVMKENPFGGNSPGRLDYYLWPYLENDIKCGRCTLGEARELIRELFIRIDERTYNADAWVESVVVGGSYPDGSSAVNPLSYIMIEEYMELDITHPAIYVRLPKEPPEDFLRLCAKYVKDGKNRAQLLCDENVIRALMNNGVSREDATDYYCGGCMEVGVQGKTSDYLFIGFQNAAKLLELCISGGVCLRSGQKLEHFSSKPLCECSDFEEFYAEYLKKAKEVIYATLRFTDHMSEYAEHARPSYLISSMIDDCLSRGRNMHGGGARYHDYGFAVLGMPNAADSLYAIKRAVFEDKICTANELTEALRADFQGFELLHKRLLSLPKYGQENEDADAMAARLSYDISKIYSSYENRFGGNGKLVILSFIWAPVAGSILAATPDGRRAGVPVAQGVTPQGMAMTKGITAAMNSCTRMPFDVFCGGASTMWDLDSAWASEDIIKTLFSVFFANGGHIFQGNTTDVKALKDAQEHPELYPSLIVRVGGYSARFVNLKKELQDDIINRIRHK